MASRLAERCTASKSAFIAGMDVRIKNKEDGLFRGSSGGSCLQQ